MIVGASAKIETGYILNKILK